MFPPAAEVLKQEGDIAVRSRKKRHTSYVREEGRRARSGSEHSMVVKETETLG